MLLDTLKLCGLNVEISTFQFSMSLKCIVMLKIQTCSHYHRFYLKLLRPTNTKVFLNF